MIEKTTCTICFSKFPIADVYLTTVNDGFQICCPHCFQKDFSTCDSCHKEIPTVSLIAREVLKPNENKRSKLVRVQLCQGCVDNSLFQCYDCGNYLFRDNCININNRTMCWICAGKYEQCTICHMFVHKGDIEDGICASCLRGTIKEYHTKVNDMIPNMFKRNSRKDAYHRGIAGHMLCHQGKNPKKLLSPTVEGKERFYGVELEVEVNKVGKNVRERAARNVFKAFNETDPFMFIKRDGSLANGFEIVSAPAYYERHLVEWEKFFNNYVEKGDLSSFWTDTCGMHIHISKNAFSYLQLGKFLRFICCPQNHEFIRCISQRPSGMHNNFSREKKVWDVPRERRDKNGKIYWWTPKWMTNEDRHTAVNLLNKTTIEVRLFKGTLKKESFFKNLEFVKALMDFSDTGMFSIPDCQDHKFFSKFVQNNHKSYPNLYAFLVCRGYCAPVKGSKIKIRKRGKKSNKSNDGVAETVNA